jgi:hypothetical protein
MTKRKGGHVLLVTRGRSATGADITFSVALRSRLLMGSPPMAVCVTGVARKIMIDGIEFKDLTFEQFTAWAMRRILDSLITKGMQGVKESLYIILPTYSEFQKAKKDAR